MNVLIVSPYQTVNPHFETELEIAQRHLAAGDQVSLISCLGEQSLCDFNIKGDRSVCVQCKLRRQMGHRQLSRHLPVEPIFESQVFESQGQELPTELAEFFRQLPERTIDDLKSLTFENFDVGYASLSSLVSSLRDPLPDLSENADRLEQLVMNSVSVYQAVVDRLRTGNFERVYVFNGRFAEMRAVLRAAQACSVDCFIHERGSTHNRFQLFKNHLPHDIDYIETRIKHFWEQGEPNARRLSAEQWFADRRQRVERNWKSFTKEQQKNLLPESWSQNRRNLVLFCSSEDEFAAIGDSWDRRPYPNQLAGVQHLLSLMTSPEVHLTVRLHPNLKNAPPSLAQPFLDLRHRQLTVVPPESPVDSYALMDAADTCLSYGSSVGVEALYHGKPSVLLGPCFYRGLGGTYQPLSDFSGDARSIHGADPRIQNLKQLINEPATPMPIDGALMYAYWMQENGIEYRYYQGQEFNQGTFKGTWIYPQPPPKSLKRKIMRFADRCAKSSPMFQRREPVVACDLGQDC